MRIIHVKLRGLFRFSTTDFFTNHYLISAINFIGTLLLELGGTSGSFRSSYNLSDAHAGFIYDNAGDCCIGN